MNSIIARQIDLPPSLNDDSNASKAGIRSRRRKQQADKLEAIRLRKTPEQLRANTIAQKAGASSWLSALLLTKKGFVLTKREFWDAVDLRYGWTLPRLPSLCACGDLMYPMPSPAKRWIRRAASQ